MSEAAFRLKLIYIGDSFSGPFREEPNLHAPLSLIALKKFVASRANFPVEISIHTFPYNATLDAMEKDINPGEADLIGVSCYFWNVTKSMKLAERFKERGCAAPIIAGGAEVEDVASILESNPQVDICARGEGEELLMGVVEALREKRELPELKGLAFRRNGAIVDPGGRGLIDDINTLPTIYDDEFVKSFKPGQPAHFFGEKGCFCNCKYCTQRPPLRRMKIERVEDELGRLLSADNITEIGIIDSDFSYDLDRAKEMLQIIKRHKKGKKIIRAHFGFLNFDTEILELFRDLSINILTAFQSTNKNTLRVAGRDNTYSLEVRESVMNDAFKILDPDKVNVAFIYGLPGDTINTFGASLKWAQRMGITDLWLVQLLALPGTVYRRDAEKYGIAHKKTPLYNVYSSSTFKAQDMIKTQSRIFWLYRMYNMLTSAQLKELAADGIYIWDLTTMFPRYSKAQMNEFLEGKDRGDFVIKVEKKIVLNGIAVSIMSDLAAKNADCKRVFSLMTMNIKSGVADIRNR